MEKKLSKDQLETLVKKAQQYDEKAFSCLFEYFYEGIYRYIVHRSANEETEDLVSETWLRVVQNIHTYKPQAQASFKSWIFRIAHNKVIDYYRTHKVHLSLDNNEDDDIPYHIEIEADPAEFSPKAKLNQKYKKEKVQKLLQKLPHIQREIIELKYLEGFSNPEIAHITGKSEGNIRVIQLRALRYLRNELEKE